MQFSSERNCNGGLFVSCRLGESGGSMLRRPYVIVSAVGAASFRAWGSAPGFGLGAELVHIGGVTDHVHIVTTLPPTVSQAQFIEQLKKVSSKWIKSS